MQLEESGFWKTLYNNPIPRRLGLSVTNGDYTSATEEEVVAKGIAFSPLVRGLTLTRAHTGPFRRVAGDR